MAEENAPHRESQVEEAMSKLSKAVDELTAKMHDIEARLSPVCRKDPPTPEPETGKQPEIARCPLAERITMFARLVQDNSDGFAYILNHLEI